MCLSLKMHGLYCVSLLRCDSGVIRKVVITWRHISHDGRVVITWRSRVTNTWTSHVRHMNESWLRSHQIVITWRSISSRLRCLRSSAHSYMCDMTRSNVWNDSFMCSWHDSFVCVCVAWLINAFRVTWLIMWVTWLIHMCDRQSWSLLPLLLYWFIYLCDQTRSCARDMTHTYISIYSYSLLPHHS